MWKGAPNDAEGKAKGHPASCACELHAWTESAPFFKPEIRSSVWKHPEAHQSVAAAMRD